MKEIEELETAVGKNIEQWNVEDLNKLNLDLIQKFKNKDVITECLDRSKNNRDVADILVPLYIKTLITNAEDVANDFLYQLEDKKLSVDEVKDKALEMIGDNNSMYHKLVGYIVLISVCEKFDLSTYEIKIKEIIADLKEVICGLSQKSLSSCYTLIMELMGILFPLRTKYFEKYNVDILDDEDGRLEESINQIHDLETKTIQFMQDKIDKEGDENV